MRQTSAMPSGPVLSVGAVVVNQERLLMVRRGRDPHAGLWSIPGGRVENGEYLADAVAREVKEETGIDVEVGGLLGILEVPGDPHYVILDHLAICADDAQPQPADDAAEARWVELDRVHELECTPRFVESLSAWGVLVPPDA